MALDSLYGICIQKIVELLRAEHWISCAENPFTHLPTKVAELIVNFINDKRRDHSFDEQMIINMRQLLTSGRIKNLDMTHWSSVRELEFIRNIAFGNAFQNLISLSMPLHQYDISYLGPILKTCSNLVDVHLPVLVDLNVFQNCKNLRSLRFHDWRNEINNEFVQTGYPEAIRNLEVFTICRQYYLPSHIMKIFMDILLKCPKLISMGDFNTLHSIELIDGMTDVEFPQPLQLRRSIWWMKPKIPHPEKKRRTSLFDSSLQCAISLCPFLEELLFTPTDIDCIQHLCSLKNLVFLSIDFTQHHIRDIMPAFESLLSQIGSKLKHLDIISFDPIPIDSICTHCPNLESFRIIAEVTASERSEIDDTLLPVKRMWVYDIDERALEFILLRCKNITELFVNTAHCIGDDFGSRVVEKQAFTKLEVLSIYSCNCTYPGFQMFLENLPCLKEVNSFELLESDTYDDIEPNDLIESWVSANGKPILVNDNLNTREFFTTKFTGCSV